jgi:hypothetical protein
LIKNIALDGTPEERRILFGFNKDTSEDKILFKFKIFNKSNLIRYFKGKDAPFHDEMVRNLIRSYRGENYINLAFRGSAKTTLAKLFLVFVLLNDEDHFKRYIKILSRDIKNPKQIVTDIYNICLELRHIYGDVFEKEGDKKREETMGSFTMKSGVKLTAGTVGQSQRGNIQDAYRPDWIFFDDVEDRESISSQPITEGIIARSDEAITGLAKGGSWCVLGNYISENGVIQWFIDKSNRNLQVTPIIANNIPTWEVFTLHDIDILKKDAEDFAGEYLCLKPDTLVYTYDGLKEIQNIQVGEEVWTHENRLQTVLQVFESEAEDLIDITVNGKVTTITKNHPVLVVVGENRVGWKKAGELTESDLLVQSSMVNFIHEI